MQGQLIPKLTTASNLSIDYNLDVLALTETWHEGYDSSCIRQIRGKGFTVIEEARVSPPPKDEVQWKNCGGVAIIAKRGLRKSNSPKPSTVLNSCVVGFLVRVKVCLKVFRNEKSECRWIGCA